jgi:hypothetical protein
MEKNTKLKESPFPLKPWLFAILLLVGIAFISYLFVLSYEGFFIRFLADDYCVSNPAIQKGLIRGFLEIYTGWTGRYMQTLFTQVGVILGPTFLLFLPTILVFGMAASQYCLFIQILHVPSRVYKQITAGLLALVVTFFFFYMNPARYQVLDWLIGSVTYTLPLIFLTLLVTIFLNSQNQEKTRFNFLIGMGIFLLALVAAGSSETNTALQITVVILSIIFSMVLIQKGKRWNVVRWEMAAFFGTFVGLVIMVLAPGNAVRQSLLPVPPGVFEILLLSFQYPFAFIINIIKTLPLPTMVLFMTGLLIGLIVPWNQETTGKPPTLKSIALKFILLPVVAYVLIASICAPTIYAYSSFPEQRAQTLAIYVFILVVVLLGYQIGNILFLIKLRLNRKISSWANWFFLASLVILAIYPVRAVINYVPEIQHTRNFGIARDKREIAIQKAISNNIYDLNVQAINSQHGIQELTEDPNNWVNRCVADSYGLESITAH